MKTIFYCTFQGEHFDPTNLLGIGLFEIGDYHYCGDLEVKGRFKGQPFNSGYIRLQPKKESFSEFVNKLYEIRNLIIENKADIGVLQITFLYENQCNWEFEPSTLSMISNLGLTLAVSCDKVQDK